MGKVFGSCSRIIDRNVSSRADCHNISALSDVCSTTYLEDIHNLSKIGRAEVENLRPSRTFCTSTDALQGKFATHTLRTVSSVFIKDISSFCDCASG